jgi:hypothetical protein
MRRELHFFGRVLLWTSWSVNRDAHFRRSLANHVARIAASRLLVLPRHITNVIRTRVFLTSVWRVRICAFVIYPSCGVVCFVSRSARARARARASALTTDKYSTARVPLSLSLISTTTHAHTSSLRLLCASSVCLALWHHYRWRHSPRPSSTCRRKYETRFTRNSCISTIR